MKPPARAKGMLGPDTPDEFGRFGDFETPARRSQISAFTNDDALCILDGDVMPEESRKLARRVAGGERPKLPHGGHRFKTGWGKTEFDPGFDENDVIDLVRRIIDNPSNIVPAFGIPDGFILYGTHNGQAAIARVNPVGVGVPAWYVATAYPDRLT